ncbi:hypothetical protein, partial [Promicromonospora sp. NPDC059942]|uniref:hypothetical protein n=1 Tax=Promicromonospora sp. NPDC059942 TaxID=3347009 RepID=UPI00366007DC
LGPRFFSFQDREKQKTPGLKGEEAGLDPCHDSGVFKREYDPSLDVFDRGCLVLWKDGAIAGYISTELGTWWRTWNPFRIQQQVWLTVVWADGEQDVYADQPPWDGVVPSIRAGEFNEDEEPHRGRYTVTWLSGAEREAKLAELDLTPPDY